MFVSTARVYIDQRWNLGYGDSSPSLERAGMTPKGYLFIAGNCNKEAVEKHTATNVVYTQRLLNHNVVSTVGR